MYVGVTNRWGDFYYMDVKLNTMTSSTEYLENQKVFYTP